MIEIRGIEQLIQKLNVDKLRAERKVEKTIRKITAKVFTDLVKNTPQWSGNLVEHWSIVYWTWTPERSDPKSMYKKDFYSEGALRGEALKRFKLGANPAVGNVLARELPKLNGIDGVLGKARWNSKIKFVNTAPYAAEIEKGLGPENGKGGRFNIRDPENRNGAYALGMMKGYIEMKYSNLNEIKKAAR